MEISRKKIMQTPLFKGIAILLLTLLLLIPNTMIQNLIEERQERSNETVRKINDKWSQAQTFCAPLLLIPYTTTKVDKNEKYYSEEHILYIAPKKLDITVALSPEERHYGIYKTILYASDIRFVGNFQALRTLKIDNSELHFSQAQVAIGITDLRGVKQNPNLKMDNKTLETTIGGLKIVLASEQVAEKYGKRKADTYSQNVSGKTLIAKLKDVDMNDSLHFDGSIQLNGSSAISFIPIGQHTTVALNGQWQSPSFIGSFSPTSSVDEKGFSAVWSILSFNREIPEMWSDDDIENLDNSSFGVNLIEPVDHYQQNMRSAKYALMFIALTFIVFFFVEMFTKKQIQVFQYVLVGITLILFYSLLLSLSEQIGFAWAYLIASAITILMTTIYFHSLIKQKLATFILAVVMTILYAFLYIILQIEDLALLFGSIFLFVILGVIMFVSNKIKLGGKNNE